MRLRKRWLGGLSILGITIVICILLTRWTLYRVEERFNELGPPPTPCPKAECIPDPNSQRIAFSSDRFNVGHEIFLMNSDGTCITQLTGFLDFPLDKRQAVRSSWSPDGSHILFELSWSADKELYLVSPDGDEVNRLTWQGRNFDSRWSPDGSQIAFKSDRDGEVRLYLMEADGSNQRSLADIQTIGKPEILLFPDRDYDWSPDGNKIAFTGLDPEENQQEVYLIDLDKGELRNLTKHSATDEFVTWWPQENKLLFISDRKVEEVDRVQQWWTLYVMEADGTNAQRVVDLAPATSIPYDQFVYGWLSGTSSQLVLTGLYNAQIELQSGVYIMDVACTLENPPLPGMLPEGCYYKFELPTDFSYEGPHWSSEAPQLAFNATDTSRNSGDIVIINYDGTNVTNLTSCSADDMDPAWSPPGK